SEHVLMFANFPRTQDIVSILRDARFAILVKQEAKMKRVLKWIGFAVAGLLRLVVAAVIVIFALASVKFNRTYDVDGC
ncbi:MAG TPA: hypothetical protein VE553_07800, partial [Candidatus Binatia bacterium]|nr:hypothetical protein [Candidatus Binatia bacterium]